MIHLTPEQIRKLQLIELEMLVEVDRICKKHKIKYNIIAGTMLGAVRHNGFIPWDDDADVALLRPEYEKFRTICETELDHERFYFQDHRNTPGYRWGYGKLRRKGTVFLRKHQEHMPYAQGVFIDIFPLDNVPDKHIDRAIQNFHCFCIRKVMWSPVGAVAVKSPLIRGWYNFLNIAIGDNIYKYYNRYVDSTNKVSSKWVRILTFPTPNLSHGYLKRWYENSKPIEFEGITFDGIADYKEYLVFKFKSYMKLPKVADRKVHPVSKLKL